MFVWYVFLSSAKLSVVSNFPDAKLSHNQWELLHDICDNVFAWLLLAAYCRSSTITLIATDQLALWMPKMSWNNSKEGDEERLREDINVKTMHVYFRPIWATWSSFFGHQKRRLWPKKFDDDNDGYNDNYDDN